MTEFLLDALAVFRLWRLIAQDDILDGPRTRWEAWAHEHLTKPPEPGRAPEIPKAIILVGCPWCLGWWLTICALLCKWKLPRVWAIVRTVLATSALVGLIAELEDHA